MAVFKELTKRSLTKAITFRFLVLISDGLIIIFITHRLDIALWVIIFSNISSTFLYYTHERIWNNIHWGKNK